MTPFLVLWTFGCGDSVVAVDDDGTSGGAGSTTSVETGITPSTGLDESSTSHGEPGFGSSTSTGGDSSDASDSSDTGAGRPGSARFLASRMFDNETRETRLYTYRDGAIAEELLATAPKGARIWNLQVVDEGGVAAYCIVGAAVDDTCYAVDLRMETPSAPQPLGGETVPTNPLAIGLQALDDDRVFLRSAGEGWFTLHIVRLDGASPGEAELVWDQTGSAGNVVSHDRSFMLATINDGMGGRTVLRASLDTPDPDNTPVVVEQPMDQSLPISSVDILPGDAAVLFNVDDTNFAGGEALYFAPIDDVDPAASIRVDDVDLREPDDRVFGPAVAPDGSGFVYVLAESNFGDLIHVDLSDEGPGDSVLVWDRDDGGVFFRNVWWSPNSRWLVFEAQNTQGNSVLHFVDASAPALEPIALTDPFEDGFTIIATFDPDGEWFYFTAAVETPAPQLYRVPITGDGPGAPELLSDGKNYLPGEFIPSPQWDAALFTQESAGSARDLFEVRIDDARPPAPQRINADLGRDEQVAFGAEYSLSGTAIIYGEQMAGALPGTIRLYDRMLDETVDVSDDGLNVIPVRELD